MGFVMKDDDKKFVGAYVFHDEASVGNCEIIGSRGHRVAYYNAKEDVTYAYCQDGCMINVGKGNLLSKLKYIKVNKSRYGVDKDNIFSNKAK